MEKTSVKDLISIGQSIWLDSINRKMIENGDLERMIGLGLRGLTSNPTIFDKAVKEGNTYDDFIRQYSSMGNNTFQIYDELTVRDIQDAADIFKPTYDETEGLDGYVSLEVDPGLAYNSEETVNEAERLHKKVNRPNVMFKVPATPEGFPAIQQLIGEGINVNITLIFSLSQYIKTAQAYLDGLSEYEKRGGYIRGVASVASVFVSRIDTIVDKKLDEMISKENNESKKQELRALMGKGAVACSRVIYGKFQETLKGEVFQGLRNRGVAVQRVLWGSTGTKNPSYSDIKYVEELTGPLTVNTIPMATFNAFLDHGVAGNNLKNNIKESMEIIDKLRYFGIEIDDVCSRLLEDGVIAFERSFDSLLGAIENRVEKVSI